MPAHLLDDAVHGSQAKSGALPLPLVVKKGSKICSRHVGLYADPRIGDLEPRPAPLWDRGSRFPPTPRATSPGPATRRRASRRDRVTTRFMTSWSSWLGRLRRPLVVWSSVTLNSISSRGGAGAWAPSPRRGVQIHGLQGPLAAPPEGEKRAVSSAARDPARRISSASAARSSPSNDMTSEIGVSVDDRQQVVRSRVPLACQPSESLHLGRLAQAALSRISCSDRSSTVPTAIWG